MAYRSCKQLRGILIKEQVNFCTVNSVQIILTTGIFWWNQSVGNCIGEGYQILSRKFVQDGFASFFLLVWQHDSSTFPYGIWVGSYFLFRHFSFSCYDRAHAGLVSNPSFCSCVLRTSKIETWRTMWRGFRNIAKVWVFYSLTNERKHLLCKLKYILLLRP